jgi:hypothetical protein
MLVTLTHTLRSQRPPTTGSRPGHIIMIVGADASFYDTYPKGADPDTKTPYVMWAGTPYQHLMAPIR